MVRLQAQAKFRKNHSTDATLGAKLYQTSKF